MVDEPPLSPQPPASAWRALVSSLALAASLACLADAEGDLASTAAASSAGPGGWSPTSPSGRRVQGAQAALRALSTSILASAGRVLGIPGFMSASSGTSGTSGVDVAIGSWASERLLLRGGWMGGVGGGGRSALGEEGMLLLPGAGGMPMLLTPLMLRAEPSPDTLGDDEAEAEEAETSAVDQAETGAGRRPFPAEPPPPAVVGLEPLLQVRLRRGHARGSGFRGRRDGR